MTQQLSDRCGSLDLPSLQTSSLTEFVERIATATDAVAISSFVTETAGLWSTARAFTLIACYRMKELFESYDTRAQASEATGYTSWTDWLTSIDWPISVTLIRTRALDMAQYRRMGASWETIFGILSNAPTAGHDMISDVVDSAGRLLSHINEDDLPDGSLNGLMEAIATAPNPGQGRALVQDVSGRPRVYPERYVAAGYAAYLNVAMERNDSTSRYYMTITACDVDGNRVDIPPAVSNWIADKLGATYEVYEH